MGKNEILLRHSRMERVREQVSKNKETRNETKKIIKLYFSELISGGKWAGPERVLYVSKYVENWIMAIVKDGIRAKDGVHGNEFISEQIGEQIGHTYGPLVFKKSIIIKTVLHIIYLLCM